MVFQGQVIKDLRTKRNLTQAKLATMLGPSFKKQHVYAYESGRCAPRVATLGRLAEIFAVEVSSFFA